MSTDALWAAFGARLRGFVATRVRGEADIDDVLQDVFAKIHAGVGKLREEAKLEAWLFQVARRAIADHHRKRRSTPLPEDVAEKTPSRDVAAVVASWLEPMMGLLPEDDREVLRLTDLQGLPQKELAARLGLSPTGARSRVQRARIRLRQAVLDCCHLEMDRRGRPVDFTCKHGPCACD